MVTNAVVQVRCNLISYSIRSLIKRFKQDNLKNLKFKVTNLTTGDYKNTYSVIEQKSLLRENYTPLQVFWTFLNSRSILTARVNNFR